VKIKQNLNTHTGKVNSESEASAINCLCWNHNGQLIASATSAGSIRISQPGRTPFETLESRNDLLIVVTV